MKISAFKLSKIDSLSIFLLLTLAFSLPAQDTNILSVGDTMPTLQLTDQYDKDALIPPTTEKVIFVSDMDASKITHPLLQKEGDPYLLKFNAVLISDIHRMPSLISRFVALPKMREYPYTIHLIREEKIGDPFPRNKGQVTLIELKSGKILKILFASKEEEVRTFLETAANPKAK
jgi:hypothetical protein